MLLKNFIVVFLFLSLLGCMKDYEANEAQNLLDNAVIDTALAAEYNVQLGLAYLESGDPARARVKLDHALALNPKLPAAHDAKAYFLESIGEPQKAESSYLTAIQLNPTGGREQMHYGAYLCRQKRFEAAERAFLSGLADEVFSLSPELYESAGLCALEAQRVIQAKGYFEKALMRDEKSSEALRGLAQLAYREKDFTKARQFLTRYQAVTGEMDKEMVLFAWQLAKSTHNKEQAKQYEALLKRQAM